MTGHILLVEDDISDEKLAVLAFSRCDNAPRVSVVRDGSEALEFLFRTGAYAAGEAYSGLRVVLLDLALPRIGGLDVLRRIRADERTRLLPVVVLSASREEADLVSSLSLGANAYVRKPMDFSEFVTVARTIASFWIGMNEPILGGRRPT